MRTRALYGYGLLFLAAGIAAAALYAGSPGSRIPLVFSPPQMLSSLWQEYKKEYIEPGSFRTLDKQRGDITTSEGQSYTMLRAVWMGDKETFDGAWKWTELNMQRQDDHLFSWLYGNDGTGHYKILTSQGGQNSASDADTDIALSLVFAYARWQDPQYLSQARDIIQGIWQKEVITAGGVPYLAADNVEKTSSSTVYVVNPSYLNPAAYRIFAQVDPSHPWSQLVGSSYALLQRSIDTKLGNQGAALPPDWVGIEAATGNLTVPPSNLSTAYGFDAMRVPWRLALDWQWFHDPRDKTLLDSMQALKKSWEKGGALAEAYNHDGSILNDAQAPAMYGGAIGYFSVIDPSEAQKLYEDKLVYLYTPDWNGWRQGLSYYDSNWAWFGIALYNKLLPNLAANIPSEALQAK